MEEARTLALIVQKIDEPGQTAQEILDELWKILSARNARQRYHAKKSTTATAR